VSKVALSVPTSTTIANRISFGCTPQIPSIYLPDKRLSITALVRAVQSHIQINKWRDSLDKSQ